MQFFQDAQALLASDTGWADAPGVDLVIPPAPSATRRRAPVERDPAAARAEAVRHNERGMQRRRGGDLRGALEDFDVALRLNPDLAVVYNNRGTTLHELGDVEGALADFDAALCLDPNYADAHGNRAALRLERGDADGAAADCRRALELAPDSAGLHARRGTLLHEQKNWLAARAEYNRALELDGGLHWVYLLRGNTYYHTDDWQALCDNYRKGFALAGPRCAGLLVRHLLQDVKKDAAAALRAADEHVRKDPANPIAHAHRGLVLILVRRDTEAETELARCRELCPESGPYLELLAAQARKRQA
jgi:tetratricopeptide (TPR) repeat protein